MNLYYKVSLWVKIINLLKEYAVFEYRDDIFCLQRVNIIFNGGLAWKITLKIIETPVLVAFSNKGDWNRCDGIITVAVIFIAFCVLERYGDYDVSKTRNRKEN